MAAWVRVGCDACNRSGKYRQARLAERSGAEIPLDDLVKQLSLDCSRRRMGTMKRSRHDASPASRLSSISTNHPGRLIFPLEWSGCVSSMAGSRRNSHLASGVGDVTAWRPRSSRQSMS